MERDDIGVLQQFAERHIAKARSRGQRGVPLPVEGHAFHAESPGDRDDHPADPPRADHPEGFAPQFDPAQTLRRTTAAVARVEAVTQPPRHPEDERKGVLRHRGGAVVRHVDQHHAALGRGLCVQVVHRGGTGRHQPQSRMGAQEAGADPRIDKNRHDFRVPRHFLDRVDKADLVAGQTFREERLFVVLGLDKNNLHALARREMLLPPRLGPSLIQRIHETRPICHL